MGSMLSGCSSLISFDLSNKNASSLNYMGSMFSGCSSLISLNLSNMNASSLTYIGYMISGCSSLIVLDLSHMDASSLTNKDYLFSECSSLISLNLSNMKVSSLTNMGSLFSNRKLLKSLDLSNMNTSKVTYMASMLSGCSSLIFLNISNMNTSSVTNMENMFYDCLSLNSINLSNFDTSKVKYVNYMFYNCRSLYSLDLSNFNTLSVINMRYMFYNCRSLYSLDLSNFDTSSVINMEYMFYSCISLNSLNISSFATSSVTNMKYMFYNCTSLNLLDISNFTISHIRATYMKYIFNKCYKLKYILFKNGNIDSFNNTSLFSSTPQNLIVCSESNKTIENGFKEKLNIFCNYNNSYYLSEIKCYSRNSESYNNYMCDACEYINPMKYNRTKINNNNFDVNCFLEEKPNYQEYSIYTNYIENIDYQSNTTNYFINNKTDYQSDTINNYIEKTDYKSDINNNFDIDKDYQRDSINNFDKIEYYQSDINNNFIENGDYKRDSNNNSFIENKTEIIQHIIDNLIEEFDCNDIDSGTDKKIVDKNMALILTSTQNQKDNEEKNNITMNLGECENILKNKYNIPKNSSLYMLQIISEQEGMKIPKMEYEVYYPLNNSKDLTKLDLSLCKDTKVEISISVKISEDLDKYNLSSGYYNDICSKTTSDSGTDIPLKDRRNEFVDNNMALCEENCDLIDYNYIKEKAKCSCDIKVSVPENYDIKFSKNDFFKGFTDIKNILNVGIMKCYKNVLKAKGLKNNYGFFLIATIIIFYFITLLLFIIISFSKLKEEINEIIFALTFNETPIKNNQIFNEPIIINKRTITQAIKKTNKKEKEEKIIIDTNTNINKRNKKTNQILNLNNSKEKDSIYFKKFNQNSVNNSGCNISIVDYASFEDSNNNINLKNEILRKKEFELNSLEYEEAIKLDNRNYWQYYISSLKYNHPILFSFGPYNDYNSKIIKIFLFFFSFCLDFTINALFFTDETMHKIYQDKGEFNLLYQIPQILYSTIISKFIDVLIKNFSLTQDIFVGLKQTRNIKNNDYKHKKLLFSLKIKFILFFALTFIFLIFCWYYITCFCGIYTNTQTHLFKDSFISVGTSLFIPFVLYLIPGIFRIIALKAKRQNLKCLYKFSLFLDNCI